MIPSSCECKKDKYKKSILSFMSDKEVQIFGNL